MADRVIGFVTVLMMSILTNRVFQLGNRVSLPIFEVSSLVTVFTNSFEFLTVTINNRKLFFLQIM